MITIHWATLLAVSLQLVAFSPRPYSSHGKYHLNLKGGERGTTILKQYLFKDCGGRQFRGSPYHYFFVDQKPRLKEIVYTSDQKPRLKEIVYTSGQKPRLKEIVYTSDQKVRLKEIVYTSELYGIFRGGANFTDFSGAGP